MEDSQINNDATCLLCCQQRQIFILPKCNHKHICWRCCINMIKQGKFCCPFCKVNVHQNEKIIFVTCQQMMKFSYLEVLKTHEITLLKSQKNSNYFYSSPEVAEKIEYETSYNCPFADCQQLFESLNQLKKHLSLKHKRQYCDICLTNRKCIHSEQILYSQAEYQRHITAGEFSQNGDLILYHPTCTFCRQTFYDIDEFRRHLQRVHEKCFICHKASQQLKYVYYQNYEQAVVHFKKSHFYCQISTCMGTKFENVFVSEEALQDHILKVHKKAKKATQPTMNFMLGFNKTEEESGQEWDKVGKNFKDIFMMAEKNTGNLKLENVDHLDLKIDIRDFYQEQVKRTINLVSLGKIKEKIEDKMYELKYNEKDLHIDDIDFFRPLEMPPLTKVQLQRFLFGVFDKKISTPIVDKFFSGRQDFTGSDQYFTFVKEKMRSYSKIAYFYAFPQMARFFKTDNPHKELMDEFYCESLLQLKVKKPFIIHTKHKYSQILLYMKSLIEQEIQERDEDSSSSQQKQLSIQKYINFLKDTSGNYYVQNQEDIFFVSKQKITNLYHMISKCRVQDFLKMNWLLKIGFSNEAYKIIMKEFYYREEQQCCHAMKKLTIQQLAYLYAYCTICLESIFQKYAFRTNKERPLPLFFSQILGKIKKSSTHEKIKEIVDFERQFLKADHVIRQNNKDKGIIINLQDHPSLLDQNIDVVPVKSKPPDLSKDFPTMPSFGTVMPKLWNQEGTGSRNNKNDKRKIEEYPSILTNTGGKKEQKKVEEEDFPVFHYVGKKNKKQKALGKLQSNLNEIVGWGGSSLPTTTWNEQVSLKNWQKREQDQKRRIQRHEQVQKQQKIQPKLPSKLQDPTPLSLKDSPKRVQEKRKKQIPPPVQEPMMFVKSKKANKIDEQQNQTTETKKKNKKNKQQKEETKKQQPQKQVKKQQPKEKKSEKKASNKKEEEQDCGLFEKIEKESEIVAKKNKTEMTKLNNFFQSTEVTSKANKKEEKIPSKSSYIPPQNYDDFSKGDFPELEKPKSIQQNQPKKPQVKPQLKAVDSLQQPKKQKRTKMRADDTSSQDESKAEHKKSEEFVSIADRFQKEAKEKLSIVNEIREAAKQEERPENLVQIKKGKKGKKVIIQSVNLNNLWERR